MKLLLTSAGVKNRSIAKSLTKLTQKSASKTKIAFIPTAANVEEGDKTWLIEDYINLKKFGFNYIDIVDISAVHKKVWIKRLREADVVLLGGGDTFHLNKWVHKSGLDALMPGLLKTKVYMGISAGSIIASKVIFTSLLDKLFRESNKTGEIQRGLGLVDLNLIPHLNSEYFKKVKTGYIRKMTEGLSVKTYALDDQSALEIENGHIQIVSEGKYLVVDNK